VDVVRARNEGPVRFHLPVPCGEPILAFAHRRTPNRICNCLEYRACNPGHFSISESTSSAFRSLPFKQLAHLARPASDRRTSRASPLRTTETLKQLHQGLGQHRLMDSRHFDNQGYRRRAALHLAIDRLQPTGHSPALPEQAASGAKRGRTGLQSPRRGFPLLSIIRKRIFLDFSRPQGAV